MKAARIAHRRRCMVTHMRGYAHTQKQMVKKMCSLYIKSSMKFNNGSGRNKKFNDIVIIHNMESSDGVKI